MVKTTKFFALFMIVLSLVIFASGFLLSYLAEQNRPLSSSELEAVYKAADSRVGAGTSVNVDFINGHKDKEKAERYDTLSVVFYVFGGLMLCGGIAVYVSGKKMQNTKIIRQHGTILDREIDSHVERAIVEFSDGSRKKLVVEPPAIVAKGDRGTIGYKKNLLVEFEKEL